MAAERKNLPATGAARWLDSLAFALGAIVLLAFIGGGCVGSDSGKDSTTPMNKSAQQPKKPTKRSLVPSDQMAAVTLAPQVKAAGIEKRQEWIYPEVDGKPAKKPQLRRTVLFNEDGLPVEEINNKDDGSLMSRWTYTYENQRQTSSRFYFGKTLQKERFITYDERGRVSEILEKDLEEDSTLTQRFTYNGADDVIEELEVEKDHRKTTVYDAEGREIETNLTTPDRGTRPIARKRYDDAGNLVEVQFPLADGFSCWKYAYDERGNQTEFRDQDFDGSVEIKRCRYDAQDRLIEETRSTEGEPGETRKTFAYDEAGRQITWAGFKDGKPTLRQDSRHDDSGRLVEQTTIGPDGNVKTKRTLRYGPHGLLEEERTTDATGQVTALTRFTVTIRKP